MLTTLRIRLKESDENVQKLRPQMSSLMHGVLMGLIDEDYAAIMHVEGMRPYSQHLSFEGDDVYWEISSLDNESYSRILMPLMNNDFKKIHLEKHDMDLYLEERQVRQISRKSLADDFYSGNAGRFFNVKFLTPAAFKQSGRYTFYPDLRCIYGSLMRRYDFVNQAESFYDEDLLEELVENTSIIKYDLKSVNFNLEGVRVPGFTGWITIKNYGPRTMSSFINMLLCFGEFSGVGIKTGLGMGAIKIMDREGR